jgi:molecular chaperone DnaK
MSLHVAVDFGTSSTCIALAHNGREPQIVVVDGQPLVPSAVFAAADGTLFVGQEAERQAAVDPARYEPHPKRRIDEGQLLLGNTVLAVADVVRAVLVRAVDEARRVAGGAHVDLLVLTHPADWGAIRTRVLLQAARGLGREIVLVPEPVAAAVFHSATDVVADGAALAVLDLGGGTVDASVISRQGGSFRVLATKGDPSFGGADVDQVLLEHVGALVAAGAPEAWRQLVEGREMADRRRRRVLRQDVRGAKETLSRHSYTDVPMPPPFPDAHVTRADLERLISAPLDRAAALVLGAVRDAGLRPAQLAGVFLVGGSSRIPLIARLVHEQSGVMPTSIDQPETVVARGALRAVSLGPERTSALPGNADLARRVVPLGEVARKITRTIAPVPPAGFGVPAPFPTFQPPPQPGRRSRAPMLIGGAITLMVIGASVAFALTRAGSPAPAPSTQPTAQGRQIAVYSYSFTAPSNWKQTGGDAVTRKVQLRPENATGDRDLIAVQEQALTYDSTADRQRAVQELRAKYDQATGLSGFDESASFAGKDVVRFQERIGAANVDWYVIFKGRAQVSVGCEYGASGRDQVRAACEQVVRTMTVTA